MFYKISLLAIMLFGSLAIHAQQTEIASYSGILKGIAFDSAHNYSLPAATIAIYNKKDTALLTYQLSNNFGEFTLKALPVGVALNLVITFTGYHTFNKEITVPLHGNNILDIKKVNLKTKENQLDEVIITTLPPPVTLNGDTLEFNANAFKLDKNAVVEDLLFKLPGVTLWADGKITVNGREVKSVMVEGKPFFGGNTQIATQNIPKDAVDKIQVYRKETDKENSLDSTMEINIMLRKNARKGYFGRVATGLGTHKSYETDGTLNIFSPKVQIQAVVGANNINRNVNNIEAVVKNASFKGVGANIEFNPDFSRQGVNKQRFLGLSYQYDFPGILKADIKRLKGEYFTSQTQTELNRNTETQIALNNNNQQFINTVSINNAKHISHDFSSEYNFNKDGKVFSFSPSASLNRNYGNYNSSNLLSDSIDLYSSNSSIQRLNNTSKKIGVITSLDYINTNALPASRLARINYHIDYMFSFEDVNDLKDDESNFESFINSNDNKYYHRNYRNNRENFNHKLNIGFGNISQLLNLALGINLDLQNILAVNYSKENNLVKDLTSGNFGIINPYLTTNSSYKIFDDIPTLSISKNLIKSLYGRYQNTLRFNIDLKGQFYTQENESQKSFQNFRKDYQSFIPAADIRYTNTVYSSHRTTYTLKYLTSNQFPQVNQLVPLVDSINTWYLNIGNIYLKPSNTKDLSFSVLHFKDKNNTFNFTLNGSIGKAINAISDSIIYNQDKIVHYFFNTKDKKYFTFKGQLSKAYKFEIHTLEFSLNTQLNSSVFSNYVNTTLSLSKTKSSMSSVSVLYRLKDVFALNMLLDVGKNSFHREGQTNKNKYYSSTASSSVKIGKKLSLNSNISYKRNLSSAGKPINFTIWNAGISQKFLAQNNIELKLSALDLLRQNKSIVNLYTENGISRTTVNVLQQYYMVTLSYFPRHFGSEKK